MRLGVSALDGTFGPMDEPSQTTRVVLGLTASGVYLAISSVSSVLLGAYGIDLANEDRLAIVSCAGGSLSLSLHLLLLSMYDLGYCEGPRCASAIDWLLVPGEVLPLACALSVAFTWLRLSTTSLQQASRRAQLTFWLIAVAVLADAGCSSALVALDQAVSLPWLAFPSALVTLVAFLLGGAWFAQLLFRHAASAAMAEAGFHIATPRHAAPRGARHRETIRLEGPSLWLSAPKSRQVSLLLTRVRLTCVATARRSAPPTQPCRARCSTRRASSHSRAWCTRSVPRTCCSSCARRGDNPSSPLPSSPSPPLLRSSPLPPGRPRRAALGRLPPARGGPDARRCRAAAPRAPALPPPARPPRARARAARARQGAAAVVRLLVRLLLGPFLPRRITRQRASR